MSSSTRIPHAEPQHAQSAGSLSQAHELDEASTREYLRLIASLHKTWDTLESQSSASVMPQRHMMDAVIAETRHGAQVEMPPTDLGPYSMSEFSLRALVRRSVDSVRCGLLSNMPQPLKVIGGWGCRIRSSAVSLHMLQPVASPSLRSRFVMRCAKRVMRT